MTNGRYDRLDFNSPLSDERAALLLAEAELKPGERAVDLGCGWGELLIRAVRGAPGSTGDGVDSDPELLDRGRRNARAARNPPNPPNAGSAHADDTHDDHDGHDGHDGHENVAVTFHQADASTWPGTGYDLAISIGSSHAWPDGTAGTLAALHKCLKPGGRAILGEGFWEQPPTPAASGAPGEPQHPPRPRRSGHRRRFPAPADQHGEP